MDQNNVNHFSEKDLSTLLNRSFLESHLGDPQHEKICESISAEVFGNSTKRSFLKRLISNISFQSILIGSAIIASAITGIVLIPKAGPEPKQGNRDNISSAEHTIITSRSEGNTTQTENHHKTMSSASRSDMYKNSVNENSNTAKVFFLDTLAGNSATPQLEPLHFNDPEILVRQADDSTSSSVKRGQVSDFMSEKPVKKKAKIKWREHEVK